VHPRICNLAISETDVVVKEDTSFGGHGIIGMDEAAFGGIETVLRHVIVDRSEGEINVVEWTGIHHYCIERLAEDATTPER
jgi:hypothetical protein